MPLLLSERSLLRLSFVLLTTLSTLGCDLPTKPTAVCLLILYMKPPSPTSATVHVGESFVGTAGAEWGDCAPAPPAHFRWRSSDSLTATVTPVDSMRASITGVRAGSADIAPIYESSGSQLMPIHVVVQP